jgi:RNA polymerase sigma factor (sigma-70 family)
MKTLQDYSAFDDSRLIELHRAGDRLAFRQIVERHQGAVCALAYSACGNVARSEELAQDAFVAAWKQLGQLRETSKLRAWLCGITRNLAHNSLRRAARTPTAHAAELSPDLPADAAGPQEHAINTDESSLMWAALAALPETYREPMVLFYREHHSLTAVAAALEISEETARQRLSRGRTMLSERMAKIVEETLERSAPTPSFAAAVLVAVPGPLAPLLLENVLSDDGSAAGRALATAGAAGGAVAKGGVALKIAASIAALPVLINGLTEYLRFRAAFEEPLKGGRSRAIATHLGPVIANALIMGSVMLMIWTKFFSGPWWPLVFAPMIAGLVLAAMADRKRRRLNTQMATPAPVFEYRSRLTFLGLPLLHVRAGGPSRGRVAKGWIAISDGLALGGLFAGGTVSVAPLSVGAACGVGLFSLGVLSVGAAALGVAAMGVWALGGFAAAIYAAKGGLAIASDLAVGGRAIAAHANDALANAFFQRHAFFRFADGAWRVAVWAAFFGWAPSLLLMSCHIWRAQRRTR